MLCVVFAHEVSNVLFSDSLCIICYQSTINSYKFISKAIKNAQTYRNFFKEFNNRNPFKEKGEIVVILEPKNSCKNSIYDIHEIDATKYEATSERYEHKIHNNKQLYLGKQLNQNNSAKFMRFTKKKYECDACKELFFVKKNIIKHLNAGHGCKVKKYEKCPQCQKIPCQHEKYLAVYKTHKSRIKCIDCDYVCWKKNTLITHVNKEHLNYYSHICQVCGAKFPTKTLYSLHFKKVHDKSICPLCDGEFKNDILEEHKIECIKTVRPFKCEICPASLASSKKLQIHMSMHTQSFPCDCCSKIYYNETYLLAHKKYHHENKFMKRNSNFVCTVCQVKMDTRKDLIQHLTRHTPVEQLKCTYCSIQCTTKEQYASHIRSFGHRKIVNPERKLAHKCKECNYQTASNVALEAHINHYHYKISEYECHICHRVFLNKVILQGHMRRHREKVVNKYDKMEKTCELCGIVLHSLTGFKKHMRLHTGEKPYNCDICNAAFRGSSERNRHKLTKHSERTVACPLCSSMFHTNGNMRGHVRKVHWKKKEKFDYTKLEGLTEADYDLFRDRRKIENVYYS